jgi:hypothetical protein
LLCIPHRHRPARQPGFPASIAPDHLTDTSSCPHADIPPTQAHYPATGCACLPPRHPKNLGIILASVLFGKPKGSANAPCGAKQSTLTRARNRRPGREQTRPKVSQTEQVFPPTRMVEVLVCPVPSPTNSRSREPQQLNLV